ncbi:MAG TPA: alpha/beta hydrolase-fold protein [Opitutaceae bacterium]|nr:alpha/beta hydrolase-fold protein [Opitutaceae bacterium]
MSDPAFVLSAPELQTDYHIFLDTGKKRGEAPLVLVMDGDDQFTIAVKAARAVAKKGKAPPLNLAGVGYGGGYRSPKNRRARDYTPTSSNDENSATGGAGAFHRFIAERLLPELYQKLGYRPPSLVITGHSLGSLFGLYALAQEKPLFDKFLVSSPSVWWDERSILKQVAAVASKPLPRATRAYFSVGEKDSASMTGDLDILEKQLAENPREGLTTTFQRFPTKNHITAMDVAFSAGLEWLFEGES